MHTSVADSPTCSRFSAVEKARLAQCHAAQITSSAATRPSSRMRISRLMRRRFRQRVVIPRGVRRGQHQRLLIESIARELRDQPSGAQNEDPVRHRDHLGCVVADQDDGHALRREMRDDAMDLGLGADIDAARRLVQDQHARRGDQPLGQQHLLLVATRQGRCQLLDPARDHPHLPGELARDAVPPSPGPPGRTGPPAATGSATSRWRGSETATPAPAGAGPPAAARCPAASHPGASAGSPVVPSIRISPRSGGVIPNSICATSDRPAPTSPNKPRISPALRSKLTSSTKPAPDRWRAPSTGLPIVPASFGNSALGSLPIMWRTVCSGVSVAAGHEITLRPERRIVTSSPRPSTSSMK